MPGLVLDRRPRAALLALLLAVAGCASPPRLIDQDPATGFAIYRSGRLSRAQLAELCAAGVEEMVVLDGTARRRECRMRETTCPGLKIRYDEAQDPRLAVSTGFLRAFDSWVLEARSEGRRIAFRCRHGWHRAGRLAAWYRMRFEGLAAPQAIAEMNEIGRFMRRHPQLEPQILAMEDHLSAGSCELGEAACPREGGSVSFAVDACGNPAP